MSAYPTELPGALGSGAAVGSPPSDVEAADSKLPTPGPVVGPPAALGVQLRAATALDGGRDRPERRLRAIRRGDRHHGRCRQGGTYRLLVPRPYALPESLDKASEVVGIHRCTRH